jgi:hypothetical protein
MSRMLLLLSHLFKTQKDIWDILQVISAVLIPLAIGLASYWIQKSISKQSVAKDYVAIATTILERPKQEGDDALREWATKLLVRYSPEPFSPKAQEQLESEGLIQALTLLGRGQLRGEEIEARSPSPDQKNEAMVTMRPGPGVGAGIPVVHVYNSATGIELYQSRVFESDHIPLGPGAPILVWSRDGRKLLVSSNDSGTARMTAFDVPQEDSPTHGVYMKSLGTYEATALSGGTDSLNFSDDGQSLILKKMDGTTEKRQLP